MGSFLAAYNDAFNTSIFFLCVLTTIFLQILSNLANDYGDTVNGADHAERQGPSRAVQSGVISVTAMRTAIAVFVVLSLLSGISLLYISFGWEWESLLFFFGLGVLSILAAITYTAGRKPYGYAGLGDLSVIIFFGLVGVMGSSYLFIQQVDFMNVLPALSCGFFAVGVLNVNNIRDIDSDLQAGKYSIPVRIGREKSIIYHWFLLIGGLIAPLIFVLIRFESYYQLLFLVTTPLFIKNGIAVGSKNNPAELDPYLKQLALSTLIFVILFGVGHLLA